MEALTNCFSPSFSVIDTDYTFALTTKRDSKQPLQMHVSRLQIIPTPRKSNQSIIDLAPDDNRYWSIIGVWPMLDTW